MYVNVGKVKSNNKTTENKNKKNKIKRENKKQQTKPICAGCEKIIVYMLLLLDMALCAGLFVFCILFYW